MEQLDYFFTNTATTFFSNEKYLGREVPFASGTRLVFVTIIRDPLDRALSEYIHEMGTVGLCNNITVCSADEK